MIAHTISVTIDTSSFIWGIVFTILFEFVMVSVLAVIISSDSDKQEP